MVLSLLLLLLLLLLAVLLLLLLQGSLFTVLRVPTVEALFSGFTPAHCRSHLPSKRKQSKEMLSERKNTHWYQACM